MKVYILSMQHVNNMGSLLQAYALSRMVMSLGGDVSFLPIKRIDSDYCLLKDASFDFSSEFEKTGFSSKLEKFRKRPINRLINKNKEKEQDDIFDRFRYKYGIIDDKSYTHRDLCIIGSDEVFNCLNAGYWGFTSQLFGNVQECKQVITYAASCGATTYDALPPMIVDRIKESFGRISGFSVRDKNTFDFVSMMTNKPVMEHLDPVFVYDFQNEIKNVTMPDLPTKYCVVYSYKNRINDIREIKQILEFCKKRDLVPVSIGAPQYWIKRYYPCSPFECLKVFQNAAFVITDTFHGTIFSYKYSENFAIIKRGSNYNKLADLIDRLCLHDHVVEDKTMDWIYSNADRSRFDISNESNEYSRSIKYLSCYF